MKFTICPDCSNDKLKSKVMPKRFYDPASRRTIVNEEVIDVEYRCQDCGWTVLVEDDTGRLLEGALWETGQQRPGRDTGVRREEGQ